MSWLTKTECIWFTAGSEPKP